MQMRPTRKFLFFPFLLSLTFSLSLVPFLFLSTLSAKILHNDFLIYSLCFKGVNKKWRCIFNLKPLGWCWDRTKQPPGLSFCEVLCNLLDNDILFVLYILLSCLGNIVFVSKQISKLKLSLISTTRWKITDSPRRSFEFKVSQNRKR